MLTNLQAKQWCKDFFQIILKANVVCFQRFQSLCNVFWLSSIILNCHCETRFLEEIDYLSGCTFNNLSPKSMFQVLPIHLTSLTAYCRTWMLVRSIVPVSRTLYQSLAKRVLLSSIIGLDRLRLHLFHFNK
jgi:hypothetical protein